MKHFFQRFFLVLVIFSLFFLVSAEQKDINYYLENIEDFQKIDRNDRNTILENANEEQRSKLFNKLADFHNKDIELVNFGSKGLIFLEVLKNTVIVDEGNLVVSDGKNYLNLEAIPDYIEQIEYIKKNNSFVLRGEDGLEIIIEEGATDENGGLKFISDNEKKIGNYLFSTSLEDYEFKGKIKITKKGFEFLSEYSKVSYEDFEMQILDGREEGSVYFNKDGVDLIGATIEKKDEFKIGTHLEDDEPFRVILGDDWSSLLGRNFPEEIVLNDVGTERVKRQAHDGVSTIPFEYETTQTRNLGEISILPDKDGNVFRFKKDGYLLNLRHIRTVNELEKYSVYKDSGQTMQEIMRSIVEDNSKGNIEFLKSNLFGDNLIIRSNPELYKDFQISDLSNSPAGIAISSKRSDGKYDVFVNPGEQKGAFAEFYNDIRTMRVHSEANGNFFLNLNPTENDNFDLRISNGELHKLGIGGLFEYGIDEIRFENSDGAFDLDKTRAIKKDDSGNYRIVSGDSLTVFSSVYDPIQGAIVNGRPISLGDVPFGPKEYIEFLDYAYNEDPENFRNKIIEIAEQSGLVDEEGLRNLRGFLDKQKEEPQQNQGFGAFFSGVVQSVGRHAADSITLAIQTDIQKLRNNNEALADVRMTVPLEEAMSIDPGGDFAQEMSRTRFEVSANINLPELEFSGALLNPLVNRQLRSVTEDMLIPHVSESFTIPSSSMEVKILGTLTYEERLAEKEYRLKDEVVKDISRGISEAIINVEPDMRAGQTINLVFQNNPFTERISTHLKVEDRTIPVNFNQETEKMMRDSIIISLQLPNLQLRGYYNRGYFHSITDALPMPNTLYKEFSNGLGFPSRFVDLDTKEALEDYLNKYYKEVN